MATIIKSLRGLDLRKVPLHLLAHWEPSAQALAGAVPSVPCRSRTADVDVTISGISHTQLYLDICICIPLLLSVQAGSYQCTIPSRLAVRL